MSSSTPLNPQPHDAVAGHDAKTGVGALQHAAGARPGEQHLIERGYVPVRQLTGKVVGVWGDAHVRLLDGEVRPLHVGDVVRKGEVVLTAQDGIVQIEGSHTRLAAAGDDVERVISQVGQGDADVVPAAGPNSGGAAGSLEEGLRVGRDSESVTGRAAQDFTPIAAPTAAPQAQAIALQTSAPIAHADTESTASNTPVTFDPRGNDTSTTAITIVAVAGQPISPGASVTLPQGTVTMNNDGTLTFTPNHDVSGSISFTYTEGNGSAGTSTASVTIEVAVPPNHAPTAADDSFSGHENGVITGNVAANDTPSADGGNTWTLAAGTAHGSVTLNADGSFSYTPAANYTGPDSFTYTVTDVDGSTSTATVSLNVAPVPLAVDDVIAARQNGSATGSLAGNDTPAAGETNTWAVATAPAHGTVTVNADGSYTYVPAANYSGPDSFTYTITAADGSTASATAHVTVSADPLATAAIGLRHDAPDDTGTSATDSLTANTHPVIDGLGAPDSTVQVTITPAGGTPITYTATTDASGHWSLDLGTAVPVSGALPAGGLPDGDVALAVSTTNGTGLTTTATGSLTVDATPPAASIDLQHDGADDTGASSTDGVTANPHPVLVGTGEPNSTVTVTVSPASGSPVTYTATTDAGGHWTLDTGSATPTAGTLPAAGLPDGAVTLQVVSIDAAGNTTTATGSFTEDRTPAAATIALRHDGADDTGASTADGLTRNTAPVLQGSAEPNGSAQVTVTAGNGTTLTYIVPTDAAGHWTLDLANQAPTSGKLPAGGLPEGPVTLAITSTDAAGNVATGSGGFTIDTTPPVASIDLRHDGADDTGASPADGITANAHPVIQGTGEPSSTVTVTVTPSAGAPVTYTATTDAAGAWSLDLSSATPTSGALPAGGLPDGAVALQVVSTDGAGNATTANGGFTINHTPPPASIDLQHDAADDTGASSADGLTRNATPVIDGTGLPNSTVQVTVTDAAGHTLTYAATTDGAGQWSVDIATATPTSGTLPVGGLAEGAVTLGVSTTDVAGNGATATGAFTIDLTPPVASIGLQHDAASDTGASSTDGVTANPHPVLVGTGEPDSTVTITVTPAGGSPVTYSATTDAAGHWSVDTATATPTGGTLPAGGLADGTVALAVASTDAAGNTTTATGSFVEDHSAPVAPTVGLKHDAADDTGASATDGITANARPILVGSAEAGSAVTITVTPATGGAITYTTTADASGHWSVDTAAVAPTSGTLPAGGLAEGTVGLQVVASDAAGNTSPTGSGSFVEDHSGAPVAPTVGLQHDAANDTGASSTDSVTSNTTPVLAGTAEALSTVTVAVTPASGGAVTYTTTADAGGHWSVDTSTATPTAGTLPAGGLVDGSVGLQVVSTDAAGNVSPTGTGSFVEDHTAPVAPTIGLLHDAADDTGASATDGLTNNTQPVLVGTAEGGSTVTVTLTPASGGAITYTTTADASGHWSVDTGSATPTAGTLPAAGLVDGTVGLSVVSTDAAGNVSATGTGSFVEDHTPPAASIDLKHDAIDDTGSSPADGITANTHPVITGSGEPDSTVTITVTPVSGGPLTYTATTDAAGGWNLDLATATPTSGTLPAGGLPDGAVGLQVSSTDAAGNSATASGGFTVSHAIPLATIDLVHDAADDTGASTTDGITRNTTPVIAGTGIANSVVQVSVSDSAGHVLTYSAATDSTGHWSVDTATAAPTAGTMPAGGLAEGAVALQVTTTDTAGNVATATGAFTEDLTAQPATIGLKHDAADDTGASATDGITRNAAPVLTGTAEAGSTLAVTVTDGSGNVVTYATTADATGHWSVDTASATPTTGTLSAGGLAEGNVALQVSATDVAGNTATATGSFTEDRSAPTTPTIGLKHDAADDTGASATDNLTNNTKPILVGTADANTAVTITVVDQAGNTITYRTVTDGSGNWSVDTANATPATGSIGAGLAEGSVTLSVIATDVAGNNSVAGTGSFTEDLTPPLTAPTISLKHDAADDTGSSATDNLTNNVKPVLVGTADANTAVTVTVVDHAGNTITYKTLTDGTGNWSVDTAHATPATGNIGAGLAEGSVSLSVVATDAAGNNSAIGTSAFTEDLTPPPTTPTISLKHDAADDTGASATDNLTNNAKPVLVGAADANTAVTIIVTDHAGNTITYKTVTDGAGNWSIDTAHATPDTGNVGAGLAEGSVSLSVVATDAAGNNSVAGTGSFLEDLTAPPTTPTISLKHDAADDTGASASDNLTNNVKPILVGTADASTAVTITVTDHAGNKITYDTTTDASGNWSINTQSAVATTGSIGAGLAEGSVSLSVVATDAAGNSSATGTGAFVEDLTAPPTTPTISLKHDAADDTGASATDNLTNNVKPILVGTADANTAVTITVTDHAGNKVTYDTTTDASGNWSINTQSAVATTGSIGAGLAEGAVALTVVATDTAGNKSSIGTSTFTEDLTAPTTTPTISLKHDAADDTGASATDNLTNNVKPILVGTADANTAVTITVVDHASNTITYKTVTDGAGNWSIDTAQATPATGSIGAGLAEGNVSLSVVATDTAGNNSVTGTSSFVEDLTPPAATPTISLKHDAADDTGASATDSLTNNVKPILVGTADANTAVTITVVDHANNTITYKTVTDGSGNWSINTAVDVPATGSIGAGLAEGSVSLSIVATDAAGNNSATGTSSFVEDLTPPAATPTISLKHDATDDTGASATDNLTNNVKPILVGTADANTAVTITVTDHAGNKITYDTTTDASGNWSINTQSAVATTGSIGTGLAEGAVALTVVATDTAGNKSSIGTSTFTEDLTPPQTTPTTSLKHDATDDTGASATDNLTNNVKPILVGTADANTAVTITVTDHAGNKITYDTTTDANGNWSINTQSAVATTGSIGAGLAEGAVALTVVATDTAGNKSSIGTSTFTEDLTPPPATPTISLKHDSADDTGASATDNLTNNTKPILVGTADANTAVTITVTDHAGNKITYDTTTDASGNWSINTQSAVATTGSIGAGLAEGAVALTVVATDTVGNKSSIGTSTFTEDLTPPPTTPTISLKHDAADDTGASATDNLTNNTKPILVGTADANTAVTITVVDHANNTITYKTVTDGAGNWSIDTANATPATGNIGAGLAEGSVSLSIVATDAAGNSSATGTGAFVEDLTAPPTTPTISLKHDAADDTGASATDNLTNNVKPILVGTADANTAVSITVTDHAGNKITYNTTTDASGNWSINTQTASATTGSIGTGLAEGAVALTVVATDTAGNKSSIGTSTFTEDLTPPPATPTISLKHDSADDTGASATDNLTNNTKPILVGTADANTAVTITVTDHAGNKITYDTTTDANGNWSINTQSAVATTGSIGAGLAEGAVALTVVATDTAGNKSSIGTSTFTEDLTPPPTTPTISLKHDAADDTGASATDNLTNNVKPILVGTADANTAVSITVTDHAGNKITYNTTTDASGNWSINTQSAVATTGSIGAGLAEGAVALTVVATDTAGNKSSVGTSSFVEDLTPPSTAPTISLKHDTANDSGTSTSDNLTNVAKPVLVGTAEAGSTVTITVTDKNGIAVQFTATTDSSGNWSVNTATATPINGTSMPATGLTEGLIQLKVVSTDAAGNISSTAGTSSFTEDRTVTASIGLKHDATNDTGLSATDSQTSNSVPVITGTGEPNTTVQVTVTDVAGDRLTYTATTDATGAWSIDLAAQTPATGTMPRDGLSDGAVSLSVTSGDAAGNSVTSTGSFTIDSVDHAATPTVSVSSVGRWLFNENTGTSTVDGYNAYTGTLTNINTANGGTAPTWITGHNSTAGSALNFDGKGGIVSVPAGDTAALTGTSTLSVWFKTTQTGSTIGWSSPSIIGSESAGDGNDIQWGTINSSGHIGFGLGNVPTVYSSQAVNDGAWHDLTITRTVNANGSSVVSIYIDGTLSTTANVAADATVPSGIPANHLAGFGYTNGWSTANGDTTTGDVYYKGALDDAHIYNHALTADQTKAIYLVENGYETQAVANDGDAIKLTVTDTNTTSLSVTGVENGMTITDGTHSVTSTSNATAIDLTGWNLDSLQLTNVGTGSATLEFDAVNTTAGGQTHDSSTWVSVVNGTSLLGGTTGNDTLDASTNTGATFISGGAGNDAITGGSGNDRLLGGAGTDTIVGGAGNDLVVGGAGNDTLTGGAGNDVFRWELADHGTAGTPNVDTITDFSSTGGNKDMLDLRDLLPNANHDGSTTGNISNYIHFNLSGTDTVIHISTTGGFSSGYTASAEDETIILKNVDLTAAGSQNDLQIIHQLLVNGQLHLG